MNLLFFVFLFLIFVSLIVSIYKLILVAKIKNMPDNIYAEINTMNFHDKARYMVSLLCNGYVLRHILVNDSPPHNDEEYKKSYCAFLNKANIDGINKIKGGEMYGY